MSEGTGAATGPQSPGLGDPELDDDEVGGTEPEVAGLGAGELEDVGSPDDDQPGAAATSHAAPAGTGGLPSGDEPDAPPSGSSSGTLG